MLFDGYEKIKELLTIEKKKDIVSEELYHKIFGFKRQKTYDDFIYKYAEYRYISDCSLKKDVEVEGVFLEIIPCSFVELQGIISKCELELCSWKIIDEKYVWSDNSFLYKVLNYEGKLMALLYYYVYMDRIFISCFEVLKGFRALGIGTKIMQKVINEKHLTLENIVVEPINEEVCEFWNNLGVRCSFV